MQLVTYVNFPGNCLEAFRYSEKHLGGKVGSVQTHGQNPLAADAAAAGIPADWKDKVLHARMDLGDTQLLGADVPKAEPMRSAYLTLLMESDEAADRAWKALSEGGQVFMKMEQTFFASRFGMCRDRFGVNWMIIHQKPMPQ